MRLKQALVTQAPAKQALVTQALAAALVVGLAYAVAPVQAHHAVQAQFDVNQTVEKKGTLVKIDWINPHTYMHFDVTEEGATTRYAIESLGVTGLRRAGIDSKSSFQVGSTFSFVINPSRNGSPTGLLVTLVFPDGRRFDVRNTDTGQVGGR
jgi:predicted amidohydrolase